MIRNFIVLGTQRTGSTALFRALNFHPAVACGGEWVHDKPPHQKVSTARRALQADFSALVPRYRDQIEEEFCDESRWLGCKVLFRSSDKWFLHARTSPALLLDRLEAFRAWLCRQSEIRIIHLTRDDSIEWLKSKYLSSKTGFYTNKPYPEGTKIAIPIRRAIKRLQTKDWIDLRVASLARTNPYLHVSYEDFLHSNPETLETLMQFLECDPSRIEETNRRNIRKQSKGTARDYISNYDELKEAVQRFESGRRPS